MFLQIWGNVQQQCLCVWCWRHLITKKEQNSHHLFRGIVSPGLWTSVFILLHLWLAWNLSVMSCYGFDSKIYLDERCSPSMVKVISLQQRRLFFFSSLKLLSCGVNQTTLPNGKHTPETAGIELQSSQLPQCGESGFTIVQWPTEISGVWCVPFLIRLWGFAEDQEPHDRMFNFSHRRSVTIIPGDRVTPLQQDHPCEMWQDTAHWGSLLTAPWGGLAMQGHF